MTAIFCGYYPESLGFILKWSRQMQCATETAHIFCPSTLLNTLSLSS
jgi:hypothetical protein